LEEAESEKKLIAPQWNMPLYAITEGASALWRKFHGAGIADSS